jgi:hypothetical protein
MRRKKVAKNPSQKEEVRETRSLNLSNVFICSLFLLTCHEVRSADMGAGLSQTSTGSIQKNYNLSFPLTKTLTVALYAADSTQKSDSTTTTAYDNKALSYKGGFIYKPDSNLRFAVSYKKIDDYNEYKGVSYAGKLTIKTTPKPTKKYIFGTTKFSIGMQEDSMTYTKTTSERYEKIAVNLGLSQTLGEFFTIGADWSKYAYLPYGTSTVSAFRGSSITDTNISDTVSNLSRDSMGGYLEYNDLSFWSVGINYSQSKNVLDSSDVAKSYEVYGDIDLTDNITISPSYTTTKSKSTTTPKTTTVAVSISLNF